MEHINFTPDKLKQFKKLYLQAIKDKNESFMFQEKEVLVAYAKYVIEYLNNQYGIKD